jgi:hypothetical protein
MEPFGILPYLEKFVKMASKKKPRIIRFDQTSNLDGY